MSSQEKVQDSQVQEALSWLHPPLLVALASFADTLPGVVDAGIQLLPVASKIVLRQQGLAIYADEDKGSSGNQKALKLTPLGEAVIAAAAVELTSVADWSERALAARDAFARSICEA